MSFSLELRARPPSPYRPTGRVLTLPMAALTETMRVLRSVGAREGCCLWLGTRSEDGTERVNAVVVPQQANRALNYAVDPRAMMAANAVAKQHGWTLIANVHSHPGVDTEHSEYDDEMMPSRKALSVVVSCHGRWPIEAWPRDIGIHEFVDNYWHLLTPRQADERVRLSRSETVEVRDLR